MPRDPKSDVLQLNLSRYHSLDVVRLPKSRKYRVVFAERFGVQRRAFVEISFDEAAKLALFLANIEDSIRIPEDFDPPTDPSRPSTMPPPVLREMAEDELDREAVPEPLPPLPQIPRAPTKPSKQVVDPEEDTQLAVPEPLNDDPRTGVIPEEYLDKPKKPD